ncbi:flippase [Candidatus Saccharibacteria bacterium]|nr:flippase [Candidatus Saccharibacteria bacterium]
MSKKNLAKNYLYNVAYEILAIIMPLITTPYLSRVLQAEKIGVYSYTLSVVTYFVLVGSLGVALYGKREIAYVQEDLKKRSQIFIEIFLLRLISTSLSMLAFFLAFCLEGEYSLYYKILLIEILGSIFDISWFYQGVENFKRTALRSSVIKILSTISVFLFVKTPDDLWIYFIIHVASVLFGNLLLWLKLTRYIDIGQIKKINIKKHLKPTLILFIPQIATQIYTILDKTMLGGIIIDKAEVGYYEQTQKVIKLLMTLATSVGTVMMPRIAATYSKGETEKIKQYILKSASFIAMIAFPMTFGLISIAWHFVPIFYGDGFGKVAPLVCIISPIIVLIGLSNVIGTQYLLPTKQQKKYTLSVLCGAAVNFILNLLLIPNYASIGASIATVFAELAVTATQFWLVRKQISFTLIIKNTIHYFLAAIPMFIFSFTISLCIENHIFSLVIQGITSILVYAITLYALHDRSILFVVDRIKHKFVKLHT